MICVIDNYDSFVYNLVQYVGDLGDESVVYRNDDLGVRNPTGAGNGLGGCRVELRAIVLGNNQYFHGHQINPFFFSASINSPASFTRTPF